LNESSAPQPKRIETKIEEQVGTKKKMATKNMGTKKQESRRS
jgi:hypothetical protein